METKILRRNYAVLVILAIILSVVVIGALGIFTIWGKTSKDVVTIMNLTTEARASELDLVLLRIEDVVDTVSSYVGARVASTDMDKSEEVLKAGLDEEIQELFQSEVEHLDGTLGYYVFYSDKYDSLVNGFAYRKENGAAGGYQNVSGKALAELEKSSQKDWYRIAASKKKPVWLPIHECSYTDGYIFSYAVPIYFDTELIGVACVDVDFEVLAKPVRDISLFGNGYAYLTDEEGKVCYHPLIGYGVLLTEDDDDVPEVDRALRDTSNHGKIIRYEYQGQEKAMAFKALNNDMRMVITANEEDVESETVRLIRSIILSAGVIMLLFMMLALFLEKLAMRPMLDRMDSLAYLDGLTGTENRTAFLGKMSELNSRIRDNKAAFGLVMFDANDLKTINDRHGHKMGDIYLMSVVEMIRDCYPGYQLYRIGGDEFVALAEGRESMKTAAEKLELTYEWQAKRAKEKRAVWEKPSVAAAYTAYDPEIHSTAEEVLADADKLMYQKKQQMKNPAADRPSD